jgi:hypothetical protein
MDECHACKNKECTHENGSNDAPEQDFVLVLWRNLEKPEDHDEHEQIVDAQRFFDEVAGEEFKGFLVSDKVIDANVEGNGQSDPEQTPEQGGFNFDDRILFMKNKEVKAEHNHDKNEKAYPKSNTYHN